MRRTGSRQGAGAALALLPDARLGRLATADAAGHQDPPVLPLGRLLTRPTVR